VVPECLGGKGLKENAPLAERANGAGKLPGWLEVNLAAELQDSRVKGGGNLTEVGG
jgi:hypothetical protein